MSVYGTGTLRLTTELFSEAWHHTIPFSRSFRVPSLFGLTPGGFSCRTAYELGQPRSADRCVSLLRHSLAQTSFGGTGILNQLCIGYTLRSHLSSRLTLGGRTFPRKPWAYGDTDFNRVYRYLCLHSHFQTLHRPFPFGFIKSGTLSYPSRLPGKPYLRYAA